jgi:hypothetical protein
LKLQSNSKNDPLTKAGSSRSIPNVVAMRNHPTVNYLQSLVRGGAVLVLVAMISDPASALVYDSTKDFTWILVCAGILAFLASMGIGANDVANAVSD